MASETVDLMDWPLTRTINGKYSLNATCTVHIGATSASNRTRYTVPIRRRRMAAIDHIILVTKTQSTTFIEYILN